MQQMFVLSTLFAGKRFLRMISKPNTTSNADLIYNAQMQSDRISLTNPDNLASMKNVLPKHTTTEAFGHFKCEV